MLAWWILWSASVAEVSRPDGSTAGRDDLSPATLSEGGADDRAAPCTEQSACRSVPAAFLDKLIVRPDPPRCLSRPGLAIAHWSSPLDSEQIFSINRRFDSDVTEAIQPSTNASLR
jgi:hypothetical protein